MASFKRKLLMYSKTNMTNRGLNCWYLLVRRALCASGHKEVRWGDLLVRTYNGRESQVLINLFKIFVKIKLRKNSGIIQLSLAVYIGRHLKKHYISCWPRRSKIWYQIWGFVIWASSNGTAPDPHCHILPTSCAKFLLF